MLQSADPVPELYIHLHFKPSTAGSLGKNPRRRLAYVSSMALSPSLHFDSQLPDARDEWDLESLFERTEDYTDLTDIRSNTRTGAGYYSLWVEKILVRGDGMLCALRSPVGRSLSPSVVQVPLEFSVRFELSYSYEMFSRELTFRAKELPVGLRLGMGDLEPEGASNW